MSYYLAKGIYPRWPVFFIRCLMKPKIAYFAQRQEVAWKKSMYLVCPKHDRQVKGPTPLFYHDYIVVDIMYDCIIMNNMIVADEGAGVND